MESVAGDGVDGLEDCTELVRNVFIEDGCAFDEVLRNGDAPASAYAFTAAL
jgi:hypothetical protein